MQTKSLENIIDNLVDEQITAQLTALLRPLGLKRFEKFVAWLKAIPEGNDPDEIVQLESVPAYLELDQDTQALYEDLLANLQRLTNTIASLKGKRADAIYDNIIKQVWGVRSW